MYYLCCGCPIKPCTSQQRDPEENTEPLGILTDSLSSLIEPDASSEVQDDREEMPLVQECVEAVTKHKPNYADSSV